MATTYTGLVICFGQIITQFCINNLGLGLECGLLVLVLVLNAGSWSWSWSWSWSSESWIQVWMAMSFCLSVRLLIWRLWNVEVIRYVAAPDGERRFIGTC